MKQRIFQLAEIYVILVVLMAIQKLAFAYAFGNYGFYDCLQSMIHGLSMDCSMAGYLAAIPGLLCIASAFSIRPIVMIGKAYMVIISCLMSLAFISNIALYSYWKFPLDFTPIFYLSTSPAAAAASLSWRGWLLAIVSVLIVAQIFYWCLSHPYRIKLPKFKTRGAKFSTASIMLLLTALLFIPIRGGFTVSTMNLSRAYFSSDMRLNHAAVNPMFSLMYSMTHLNNLSEQFQYMPQEEAQSIIEPLYPKNTEPIATLPFKPDIYLIILESFSSHLFPSLGGEEVAVKMDSLGREGLMFSNIYASSFRTDRALPAILNGYPAQPTTSLLKYVNKLDSLPSLGKALSEAGYSTSYYYGGDINFTNMNALLVAGGFNKIICDKDFPISERLSKWGVHDEIVFKRALTDSKADVDGPRFTVIQTSSSHEPFEVPFQGPLADPRANAFQYTDSCVWDFVEGLRSLPNYDRTLIALIPDHYGAYPPLENHIERHQIPLIFAGGAVRHLNWKSNPLAIVDVLERIGSQTDLAATILALAGVDDGDFSFSNNLLDSARQPFAFFSEPSWIGLLSPEGYAEIQVDTHKYTTNAPDSLNRILEGYIQSLYFDLDSR